MVHSFLYLVPPWADFLFCFFVVTQWVWEGWEVFGILLESVTLWWMKNVSKSLIILKAQPLTMVHQKSFFWHALRLPEAALESNTGLCETAGRDEQCRLWKLCSFFLQKESWSETAALASEYQSPGHSASRAAIWCEFQPGTALLLALGTTRQWGGTLHFSRNLWGRNRKLGRTVWEPVFWSSPCHLMVFCAPSGSNLMSLLRLITWLLNSAPILSQVLKLSYAS